MPIMSRAEMLSGVGVAIIGILMFHLFFGDSWGKSAGLGTTAGIVNSVTQIGMRRVGERRVARQAISVRARGFLGIGMLLTVMKVGLDLGEVGPAGIRSVLGISALMSLLFAAYEVARKATQNK